MPSEQRDEYVGQPANVAKIKSCHCCLLREENVIEESEERDEHEKQLCSDKDVTVSGYLGASHMPMAAPSDRPEICAFGIPTARMKAATSSARSSVE